MISLVPSLMDFAGHPPAPAVATTGHRTWVVALCPRSAGVYAWKACGHPGLEPEAGMQLNIPAEASAADEAHEKALARLRGGLVGLAEAGGRFDTLVVVGSASARMQFRAFLSVSARKLIVSERERPSVCDPRGLAEWLAQTAPRPAAG